MNEKLLLWRRCNVMYNSPPSVSTLPTGILAPASTSPETTQPETVRSNKRTSLERMNEDLYIAHKNNLHTKPRVFTAPDTHRARYTQRQIHRVHTSQFSQAEKSSTSRNSRFPNIKDKFTKGPFKASTATVR